MRVASGQAVWPTRLGLAGRRGAVGVQIANYFAGDLTSRGGVRVAVAPALTNLVTAGSPAVLAAVTDGGPARQFDLAGQALASFAPLASQVGGVFVGRPRTPPGPIVPATLRASLGLV